MSTESKFIYDRVFVLAADLTKSGDTFTLAGSDAGGVLLSDWRIKACAAIIARGLVRKIIIVGWHDEEFVEVSRSGLMRTILIRDYGIDADMVESVEQFKDGTIGNVQEILEYIEKHGLDIRRCAILSNFYHLPRAMAFFYSSSTSSIKFLAAESFLPEEIDNIKRSYASDAFSSRLESELTKLRDLG